jgi:plasmid stabilization system protein ParE
MPYRQFALAEQDLDEIWSYVSEDAGPVTADRLIDAIIDRFELLAEQPRMGPPPAGVRRSLHGRRDQTAAWSEPGPLFIGSLVGVGCRLMVPGPGLGTLAPIIPSWKATTQCLGEEPP